MGKFIRTVFKTETLSLCECTDGYYLYDTIQGSNISMYKKTEQEACIEALLFYQKRYGILKSEHKELNNKVDQVLSILVDERED